jgi:hypothetical protein
MEDYDSLKVGDVIEGPFWPERVKVVSFKRVGNSMGVSGVGLQTNKYYSSILSKDDVSKIKIIEMKRRDFSFDPESFFLVIEGKRIRLAHQFDPLYAVNVSQIDPLPHQIDAVYFHILRNPKIKEKVVNKIMIKAQVPWDKLSDLVRGRVYTVKS